MDKDKEVEVEAEGEAEAEADIEEENTCRVICLADHYFRKSVAQSAGLAAITALTGLRGDGGGGGGGAGAARPAQSRGASACAEREPDLAYLTGLDPKEWKSQDHYAVLGLGAARHAADEAQIKSAYRRQVLRHHPDKRKAKGETVRAEEDYFACITRAYEILGDPAKRRSYDSVDPEFDDSIPSAADSERDGFYAAFGPCFDLNARWSERRNVPRLGDDDTPREAVEKFYSFWYDFDSWREYSYDDEEEKEKGQDREERRWIEKQNRAVRAKRKKEEMARIRALVDAAYACDPRIDRFKLEDKEKKLAVKKARRDAAQARRAEEEKAAEEARLAKELADKEERERAERSKAEKERLKKIVKKERKTFRDFCKSNGYFAENDKDVVEHMTAVEKICEMLQLAELQDLNRDVQTGGREIFAKAVEETERRLDAERLAHLEKQKESKRNRDAIDAGTPKWTPELIQILIKSVNFFPAGTNQRWEVVANFVNGHGCFEDEGRFTAKDVLGKAKDLQSSDFSKSSLKVAANSEAFDKFEKQKRKTNADIENAEISISFDGKKDVRTNGDGSDPPNGDAKKKEETPWTKSEQELLEQAIKTYPASTPERWDRIAECIPTRSKKECMKRFKELVDLVKAKKQASQLTSK